MSLIKNSEVPMVAAPSFPQRKRRGLIPLLMTWLALLLALLLVCGGARAADDTSTASAQDRQSYQALADALDNPDTRERLVAHLRDMGEGADGSAAADQASGAAASDEENEPWSGGVVDATQHFGDSLVAELKEAGNRLKALSQGEGLHNVSVQEWLNALLHLFVVLAVSLVAIALLRRLGAVLYRRVNQWAFDQVKPYEDDSHLEQRQRRNFSALSALYGRVGAIVGTLIIDLLIVLVSAFIGYGVGLLLAGDNQGMVRLVSSVASAFFGVEICKALVRTLFSSRYPSLRLIPIEDESAAYWTKVLCRLVGTVGYGLMVLVPLIRLMFSPAAGQVVNLVVMLAVYIYALKLIIQNRRNVTEHFQRNGKRTSPSPAARLAWMLARSWSILAIIYFTVLLVMSQLSPATALPFILRATLQTGIAVLVALFLSALAMAFLGRHYSLSDNLRARLPKLEQRLNSYAPIALTVSRIIIGIATLVVILDGWHLISTSSIMHSSIGQTLIFNSLHVLVVLLIATAVWVIFASVIEHRLTSNNNDFSRAREQTLLTLLRNAMLIVIVVITLLVVLSQIGINIGPLIASAGVIGLAVSFGAQKLVQDIITGVFIQLENGMNQNDVVEAAGVFGTVERLTIRSVGIRTLDGGYHLIPFSTVTTLTNHMRDFSYHLGEYTIGHRENVDEAIERLRDAFEELMTDPILSPEVTREEFSIPGVVGIGQEGIRIRVLIKTTPGMQWAVQRGYDRLVKSHFDAARIEMPYPQTVLHFAQDKNGDAAPMRVVRGDKPQVAHGKAPAPGQTPRHFKRSEFSDEVLGNEHETGDQGQSEKGEEPESEEENVQQTGEAGQTSTKPGH
ncbi:mechanosensitive ion channel domain-containing protein [Carnimonas nigrificans]|uniref:mechanosensitive ion channel domain-containing protein n=1 Tax=Carnimonas nigrificans TaxID=64323 RepID=UPI00146FC42F|nr:mechanosensitive ion channel domain-containing protein [Carnimonas nigrificans]